MSKPIHTYDDLIKHKNELDLLLKAQRELVVADLKMIQAELKAPRETISLVSKMVAKNKKNPLLNLGLDNLIDLVLKRFVLARTSWVTKTALSFLAKNYSSHYVQNHKKQFLDKLFSWIGHRNHNGKSAPEAFGAKH